jgi:hypothetical protein
MNNWCICWFLRIFLLGILIFKWLTARRLYKSFGVKGLILSTYVWIHSYLSHIMYIYRHVLYRLVNIDTDNIPAVQRCTCGEIFVFPSTISTGQDDLWQEMCLYFMCVQNCRIQNCLKESEHFSICWVTAITSINRTAQNMLNEICYKLLWSGMLKNVPQLVKWY